MKNILKKLLIACAGCTSLFTAPIFGECLSKIEIAPAFVHIDVLEKKNTVKKINMGASRVEGNFVIGKGWLIKPIALYGKGDGGELTTLSLGFGRCIPVTPKLIFTPSIGVTYTSLNTTLGLEIDPFGTVKFRESFHAISPYIGIELNYRIKSNLRVGGSVQYAWSRCKTHVKHLFTYKGNSQGPNLSGLIEYDLNSNWSVNLGLAYNESLSKDKDGLRGYGAKLGLARWF